MTDPSSPEGLRHDIEVARAVASTPLFICDPSLGCVVAYLAFEVMAREALLEA